MKKVEEKICYVDTRGPWTDSDEIFSRIGKKREELFKCLDFARSILNNSSETVESKVEASRFIIHCLHTLFCKTTEEVGVIQRSYGVTECLFRRYKVIIRDNSFVKLLRSIIDLHKFICESPKSLEDIGHSFSHVRHNHKVFKELKDLDIRLLHLPLLYYATSDYLDRSLGVSSDGSSRHLRYVVNKSFFNYLKVQTMKKSLGCDYNSHLHSYMDLCNSELSTLYFRDEYSRIFKPDGIGLYSMKEEVYLYDPDPEHIKGNGLVSDTDGRAKDLRDLYKKSISRLIITEMYYGTGTRFDSDMHKVISFMNSYASLVDNTPDKDDWDTYYLVRKYIISYYLLTMFPTMLITESGKSCIDQLRSYYVILTCIKYFSKFNKRIPSLLYLAIRFPNLGGEVADRGEFRGIMSEVGFEPPIQSLSDEEIIKVREMILKYRKYTLNTSILNIYLNLKFIFSRDLLNKLFPLSELLSLIFNNPQTISGCIRLRCNDKVGSPDFMSCHIDTDYSYDKDLPKRSIREGEFRLSKEDYFKSKELLTTKLKLEFDYELVNKSFKSAVSDHEDNTYVYIMLTINLRLGNEDIVKRTFSSVICSILNYGGAESLLLEVCKRILFSNGSSLYDEIQDELRKGSKITIV